jgi:hypothetical protein
LQALDKVGPVSIPLAEMVKLLENTFRMINIGLASRWKSKQSGIEARVTISQETSTAISLASWLARYRTCSIITGKQSTAAASTS